MRQRVIVWIVVLLFAAGLFTLVLRYQNTPQTAAQAGRRAAMMGGPVAVVPATAQKGDIGVYQEAIGTVTPVYTSSITSQVTGQVMDVHYTEGQMVKRAIR
jgi:multidrug efflux system membrane fusion protein